MNAIAGSSLNGRELHIVDPELPALALCGDAVPYAGLPQAEMESLAVDVCLECIFIEAGDLDLEEHSRNQFQRLVGWELTDDEGERIKFRVHHKADMGAEGGVMITEVDILRDGIWEEGTTTYDSAPARAGREAYGNAKAAGLPTSRCYRLAHEAVMGELKAQAREEG